MQDQLLHPVPGILQWFFIRNIKDNTGCFRQVEVIVDNSPVPLLSCRIPEFEVVILALMSNFFEPVVDADGGFLRIVLALNISEKKSALSDGSSADNDGFKVPDYLLLISHIVNNR